MVLSLRGHAPDYLTSKVLISQKKALCIITTDLSLFYINSLKQNNDSFLFCELSLVIFYWQYILALEDNCNFAGTQISNQNQKKPAKPTENN